MRTQSGPFRLEQAFTLDQLQNMKDEGRLEEALVAMSDLLPEFPGVFVDDVTATNIRHGRDFNVSPFRVNLGSPHVKAIGPDGRLVAIGRIAMPHIYHPVVVLGLLNGDRAATPRARLPDATKRKPSRIARIINRGPGQKSSPIPRI